MSDNSQQYDTQEHFADIFSHLRDLDIEQFYAQYQLWVMRHRVPILENEIEVLRAHITENQQFIQDQRPSAIALAVLARLQSNGVSDIELLDQMLERGEDWLDRMMQRLDYCEQVEDFIQGDYTQWCVNSLEGAYDWIDSLRGSTKDEPLAPQTKERATDSEVQATAELLLHKLSFDDEEAMQDAANKPLNLSSMPPAKENESSTEKNLENADNPTYVQALEILSTDNVVQTHETSVATNQKVAEPEQVSLPKLASTSEQPAPWYSISLEEHEPFDFERPGSMDDWITVLQSDIAPAPDLEIAASNTTRSQTNESPKATTPNEQAEAMELIEPPSASEPSATVTYNAEISEVVPAASETDTRIKPTIEVLQEVAGSESETRSEQNIDTIQKPSEILAPNEVSSTDKIILAEAEQKTMDVANKPMEVSQESPYMSDKFVAQEGDLVWPEKGTYKSPEVLQEIPTPKKKGPYKAKKTPKLKPKTSSKSPKKSSLPTNTQKVANKIVAYEASTELVVQPHEQAEEAICEDQQTGTHVEGLVQTAPEAGAKAEVAPTIEANQPTSEEASHNDARLEPEEGQLPWYEYLVIEQAVTDEVQVTHEAIKHDVLGGEQQPILAEQSDKTQPIALKKIKKAKEQQQVPESSVLPTNDSASLRENSSVENDNQEEPKKPSFWQKLKGEKRKK